MGNKEIITIKSSRRHIYAIVGIVLTVVTLLIISIVAYSKSPSVRLQRQLDLGNRYLSEMDYENAIIAYETAIEIDADNLQAYEGLANTYIEMSDSENAIAIYEKAETIFAENFPAEDVAKLLDLYRAAAKESYSKDNYDEAIVYCKKFIEKNTENDEVVNIIVQINLLYADEAEKASDYDAAERYFNEVLKYDPNNELALEGLERISEKRKLLVYESALREMARKIINDPSKYDFSDALILSDEYAETVSNLSEPVFFDEGSGIYIGVYPNGYIYYGEMTDNKRNGLGYWYHGTNRDIEMVICYWENDLPNGAASIEGYANESMLNKQPGRTYMIHSYEYVDVKDGIYSGDGNMIWELDNGGGHDWDITFIDGYAQSDGRGYASYCKYCNATLRMGNKRYMIHGLGIE